VGFTGEINWGKKGNQRLKSVANLGSSIGHKYRNWPNSCRSTKAGKNERGVLNRAKRINRQRFQVSYGSPYSRSAWTVQHRES